MDDPLLGPGRSTRPLGLLDVVTDRPPSSGVGARRTRTAGRPWVAFLSAAATGVVILVGTPLLNPTHDDAATATPAPPVSTTTPEPASPARTTTAPSSSSTVPTAVAGPPTDPSPVAPGSDNPLAGLTFYGPNTGAAEAAARLQGTAPADAALLTQLASVPTATWLGDWSGDITSATRQVVQAAAAHGAVPVLVAYNIPGRGCAGYSAGGEATPAGYARWIRGLAAGIGGAEAVVVLEPDALAQVCGDETTIYRMLADAVTVLGTNPGTHTYIDAGNAHWIDAGTMSARLRSVGVADADGFALNVSNFHTTADNTAYGRTLSALVDGAHFVVDTSRNGRGPGDDWCNPAGRGVGQRPTSMTGDDVVDAYLWIKTPGESDGTCNGGPEAGVFWPEYAVALSQP